MGEPRVLTLWELLIPGATVFTYPFPCEGLRTRPCCQVFFFFAQVPLRETAVAGAWQPDLFLADAKVQGIQILAASQTGPGKEP